MKFLSSSERLLSHESPYEVDNTPWNTSLQMPVGNYKAICQFPILQGSISFLVLLHTYLTLETFS